MTTYVIRVAVEVEIDRARRMSQIKPAAKIVASLACAAFTACASNQPPQVGSIDFARGCWVQKDEPGGNVEAFLRLLPDPINREKLSGHLQFVNGDVTTTNFQISITGADATVTRDNETLEYELYPIIQNYAGGTKHTSYVQDGDERGGLSISSLTDKLSLRMFSADKIYRFNGERDGCD